jgi:hypothetical protein
MGDCPDQPHQEMSHQGKLVLRIVDADSSHCQDSTDTVLPHELEDSPVRICQAAPRDEEGVGAQDRHHDILSLDCWREESFVSELAFDNLQVKPLSPKLLNKSKLEDEMKSPSKFPSKNY